MSAVRINLQHQLLQFLKDYSILVPKENDQVHIWKHLGVEHKLSKDTVTRLVASIVTEWIREGVQDITEVQYSMDIEDVVNLVRGLVRRNLAAELGVR